MYQKTATKYSKDRQIHFACLHQVKEGYYGSLQLHKTRKKTKTPVTFSIPYLGEQFPQLANACAASAIKTLIQITKIAPEEQLCSYLFNQQIIKLTYPVYLDKLNAIGLQCGLDDKALTTHVPRISAATLAAEAGLTEEQIRAMGNWVNSKSMRGYIRVQGNKLKSLQKKIAKHVDGSSTGKM